MCVADRFSTRRGGVGVSSDSSTCIVALLDSIRHDTLTSTSSSSSPPSSQMYVSCFSSSLLLTFFERGVHYFQSPFHFFCTVSNVGLFLSLATRFVLSFCMEYLLSEQMCLLYFSWVRLSISMTNLATIELVMDQCVFDKQ